MDERIVNKMYYLLPCSDTCYQFLNYVGQQLMPANMFDINSCAASLTVISRQRMSE